MSKRGWLRPKPRISYFEPDEPNLDEYIFCEKCSDYVYEYCSIHGPLLVIPDDKVPAKHNYPSFVPRAALTIPRVFLHLNYSTIPGAGLGVFTTLTLPKGVRFGPYRGVRSHQVTSDYSWQIYGPDRKPSHVVDASDGDKSNWMRFVNCSRHWCEQNLVAFQYQGELYYRTIKIIPRYTELMVFYGSEFANKLRIDLGKYNAPKIYAQKFGAPVPKKLKVTSSSDITQESPAKPSKDQKDTLQPTNLNNNNEAKSVTQKKVIEKRKNEQTDQQKDAPEANKRKTKASERNKLKPGKIKKTINTSETNTIVPNGNLANPSELLDEEEKILNISDYKSTISNEEVTFHLKSKIPNNANTDKNIKVCQITNSIDNHNSVYNKTIEQDKLSSNTEIEKIEKIHEKVEKFNLEIIEDAYFKCNHCNYQTVTKEILARHMRLHDPKRKFVCATCGYRFNTERVINRHNICHRNETNSLKVLDCNNSLRESDLKSNPINVSKEKLNSCNICEKRFSQPSDLKRHLRIHSGEKLYSCNICEKRFSRAGHLKCHLRIHSGEKIYSCNICEKRFTRAEHLKCHLRTHTGEKLYSCNICEKRFSQAGHLKCHLRIHSGEKLYSCNICEKRFTQAGVLKRHLRIHSGEKLYSCNICEKRFTQASYLKRHLRTHSGEKIYSCNICEKRFTQAGVLKRHLRIHSGEKIYSCNICEKRFTQASYLKRHLRTHSGEKLYSCNICEKRFTQAGSLKRHLRIHSGEKPYSCDICDYKSSYIHHLKTHLRTHSGEKLYSCNICEKRFTRAEHLKYHLRIHSGEKPYSCDICDYKSLYSKDLQRHLKRKHLS